MNTLPRISIVGISLNQGAFLEKSIRSVVEQGYPNLEYFMVDGGSTDGSVDIIRRYEKHFAWWVSEPDRGQTDALNKGLSRCTGTLMGWLNSDDYFVPGALLRFAEAWHQWPAAGAWIGGAELVEENGHVRKIQRPGKLDAGSLADWEVNGFSQPACLFSLEAWRQCGPVDESLFIAMDLDLWLKIARQFELRAIDATLAGAIIHSEAKTQKYVSLKHAEVWQILMRYGFEETAKRLILKELEDAEKMRIKLDRVTRHPLYKLVRPLVKRFLKPA